MVALLYRNALSAAATAEAECLTDVVTKINATNAATDAAVTKSLNDEVASLRREIELSDQAGQEALQRARDADARLRKFQAEQKAQKHVDTTYAAWARTPLPDAVAQRLRDAATGGADDGGSDPLPPGPRP